MDSFGRGEEISFSLFISFHPTLLCLFILFLINFPLMERLFLQMESHSVRIVSMTKSTKRNVNTQLIFLSFNPKVYSMKKNTK